MARQWPRLVQEADERAPRSRARRLAGRALQLRRGAREEQLAVGQHEQPVGVALGLADVVRRVDHGRAARGELATNAHSRSRWRGSSDDDGSSSSSTGGSPSSPTAMLTRWRLPPDSLPTSSPARSREAGLVSIRATVPSTSWTFSSRANSRRFSATESFV